MKIVLLHLSDIHLGSSQDPIAKRASKIKEAVLGVSPAADACFIVVTGDVAFSGNPDEYSIASSFFEGLRSSILLAGINQVEIIVVPGNHDCNFARQTDTRAFLLGSLTTYLKQPVDFAGQNFRALIGVQDDFFQFEAAVRGGDALPISDRIYFQRTLNVRGSTVIFHCFNTAWLSRKNEIQSELFIPHQALPSATPPSATLSVAMFHHPFNWLDAENYRGLKSFVESQAEFILTGHEHEVGFSRRQGFNGEAMNYLDAPALQTKGSELSGFQILAFDFESQDFGITLFEWHEERFSAQRFRKFPFERNLARPDNPFKIAEEHSQVLTAIGTGFRHPRCSPPHRELRLRDLYVYPDLRERRACPAFS